MDLTSGISPRLFSLIALLNLFSISVNAENAAPLCNAQQKVTAAPITELESEEASQNFLEQQLLHEVTQKHLNALCSRLQAISLMITNNKVSLSKTEKAAFFNACESIGATVKSHVS